MRTCLILAILACCLSSQAHIGSPNVFLEDKAGEYPVRVVIRPPNVVPGLAEITVRVQSPVQRVTVLPVFWNAGREGSPPPDEATLVRGETNLYSAQLWLMKPGAYSVDVTVEGPRGKGTLVVPVNSVATNTRPMSLPHIVILSALAAILFLSGLKIAGAIFGEARVEPSATVTAKDRSRSRIAMVGAAVVLFGMLFGGRVWWNHDDRNYRNNALYKPLPIKAEVRAEKDQPILTLAVDPSVRRGKWTPLIPDHGKLMHLFLVREGKPGAFAHLHPTRRDTIFEVALPPLPSGKYNIYADVTHEDGFSETLTATAEFPSPSLEMKRLWLGNSPEPVCSAEIAQALGAKLPFPPDADDSWQLENPSAASGNTNGPETQTASAGGGYKIIWQNPRAATENLDESLRFTLMAPDNKPAPVESYMGMRGHAVIRRDDGSVFAHIHPVGTFSMAAQQFFVTGKPKKNSTAQVQSGTSVEAIPAVLPETHLSHTNEAGVAGEISFPYAFPSPGPYRLWIQMKTQGRILTGSFDATVGPGK